MKTGIVALLGIFYMAFGMETMAGRGGLVKSHFEVIKTVNETMVYYLKRTKHEKSDCIGSDDVAHYGILSRYPNSHIHPRGNVYDIEQNGQTTTFEVCEGGRRPVYLEHDIITLTPNVCQFSAKFCDIKVETAFWLTSPKLEVIAKGQADVWILGQHPFVKLLVFNDVNGKFILQLLKEIKNDEKEEVWVTNVNGLQAREIPTISTANNFSHLGQYLTHSDFLNINEVNAEGSETKSNTDVGTDNDNRREGSESESEGLASRILSQDQMVFYTFILIVILVAFYFLERIFGIIINCIILSRTRNHACSALCFKSLSQNMMNNHLYRYYTDESSVPKTTNDRVYGINGNSENKRLSSDIISMDEYNKVYSGYFE